MNTFKNAWAMFQHYAPWLVIIGIPSIINGLMPYPRAAGFVKFLHGALEFVSVLSRSDSPSTFKVPFAPSSAPNVIGQEISEVAGGKL